MCVWVCELLHGDRVVIAICWPICKPEKTHKYYKLLHAKCMLRRRWWNTASVKWMMCVWPACPSYKIFTLFTANAAAGALQWNRFCYFFAFDVRRSLIYENEMEEKKIPHRRPLEWDQSNNIDDVVVAIWIGHDKNSFATFQTAVTNGNQFLFVHCDNWDRVKEAIIVRELRREQEREIEKIETHRGNMQRFWMQKECVSLQPMRNMDGWLNCSWIVAFGEQVNGSTVFQWREWFFERHACLDAINHRTSNVTHDAFRVWLCSREAWGNDAKHTESPRHMSKAATPSKID